MVWDLLTDGLSKGQKHTCPSLLTDGSVEGTEAHLSFSSSSSSLFIALINQRGTLQPYLLPLVRTSPSPVLCLGWLPE
jgi:hypothetical protein